MHRPTGGGHDERTLPKKFMNGKRGISYCKLRWPAARSWPTISSRTLISHWMPRLTLSLLKAFIVASNVKIQELLIDFDDPMAYILDFKPVKYLDVKATSHEIPYCG
jgi:hypothetical protein